MSESQPSLPAETQPRQTKPIGKFDKLFPTSRKPAILKELTAKHRLLIQYQVWGCEHDFIRKMGREPFEPLTLIEAAKVLEIRLKNARQLQTEAVYQKEYARQMKAWRDGRKCEAWRKVDEILRDDGDGSAAVRKVQLAAANMLIGEQAEARAGTNVSVQVNTAINLQPGIVVRLPASAAAPPLERMTDEGEIIDAIPLIPAADHSQPVKRTFDGETLEHIARQHPHVRDGE